MSIKTEIERISGGVKNAFAALTEKGVTVPADARVDDMAGLIAGIEAGGGSGGGDLDALIDGSITEVTSNVEIVVVDALRENKYITSVNLPNAHTINQYAFYNCKSLKQVNIPEVNTIGQYAFADVAISSICLPSLTTLNGGYQFQKCKNLLTADMPVVNSVAENTFRSCDKLREVKAPRATGVGSYAFVSCSRLELVDFTSLTGVSSNAFISCASLVKVILRNNVMANLVNVNAFSNCYHFHGTVDATYNPDGLKDGYIYVPRALVDSYKAATNWSTFATQFRDLESYTVDGTITGELDGSKI